MGIDSIFIFNSRDSRGGFQTKLIQRSYHVFLWNDTAFFVYLFLMIMSDEIRVIEKYLFGRTISSNELTIGQRKI